MTNFRLAAMAAALLAGGAAQAQTTIITEQPAQTQTVVREQVVLTPVQRQTIYRIISHERALPAAPIAPYSVGTRVPAGVTLYPVPDTVVAEVPTVKRYKYMVVNGRAILVDPVTSEVVAEVGD